MTRRELFRLRKRSVAHLRRAAVILALVFAVVLMVCGCLYIAEHLFQKDDKIEASKTPDNENPSNEDPDLGQITIPEPDSVEVTNTQIKNTYNYEYVKPDASGLSIVLDAGHGGIDGGTEGVGNQGILEKNVNLEITQKVTALLKDAGANVTPTRDTDEYVDLAERTTIGNRTGASLFVSLHCNFYEGDSSIDGLEIYYHRNSNKSKGYAETMIQLLKDANSTVHIRNASQQNMQVLRNSSIPAIMIEMGFLSNPEECASLTDPLYQEFLSRMITSSIVETLKTTTTQ